MRSKEFRFPTQAMSGRGHSIYEFGPFRVDAERRLLLRDKERVPLQPKAFKALLLLVEKRGHVVTKDELLVKVWPNTSVEEGSLAVAISQLRKTLGQENGKRNLIETISRVGYR